MQSGANLTFDISSPVTIPNPIAGDQASTAGSFTKQGPAILTLNGANTYTGLTDVQAGELRIDGSILNDIQVATGATLSGNFTVLNGNVNNAGILSPGDNAVGQININGNLITTGTVLVDITPTGTIHDTVMLVSGTGTLSGTLNVIINDGNYIAGTQYEVISGPTTGTFNVVKSGVNANNVEIDVTYGSVIVTILNSRIFQNQTISGSVQQAVANCIQSATIVPNSDFSLLVQLLGTLNNSDLNRALYRMSPVNYGALDWINARNNNYVADILSQHLFELCCSPRDWCSCQCSAMLWLDFYGNWMNNHKKYDNLAPFHADAYGVIGGLDYTFCGNWLFGLAAGYTHTNLHWKQRIGSGKINSYYGAFYGSFQSCCLDVDISAIGGASDHHLKRQIHISRNVVRDAKGHPWGYFFTGHLGLRTDWDWCCTVFEPFALVDYDYFQVQSFKEHGADSLNLRVQEHHQNMLRGEAGLKVYRTYDCDCFCFAPYIGVSWVGEFPLGHAREKASFVGQDCTINVKSYHKSVQLVSPQAGIKFTNECGASIQISYKGLFNDKTRINEADVRLEWLF